MFHFVFHQLRFDLHFNRITPTAVWVTDYAEQGQTSGCSVRRLLLLQAGPNDGLGGVGACARAGCLDRFIYGWLKVLQETFPLLVGSRSAAPEGPPCNEHALHEDDPGSRRGSQMSGHMPSLL